MKITTEELIVILKKFPGKRVTVWGGYGDEVTEDIAIQVEDDSIRIEETWNGRPDIR